MLYGKSEKINGTGVPLGQERMDTFPEMTATMALLGHQEYLLFPEWQREKEIALLPLLGTWLRPLKQKTDRPKKSI
jgi:hypothetical protein